MDIFNSVHSVWLIPLLIFLSRVIDVTIGTLRIIFVSKGMKYIAPLLGFFEVFIWLIAIGQIMQNLTNWVNYIAYSAGFATGNFIGILIENKLAMGLVSLRIITESDAVPLIKNLSEENFGLTRVGARGVAGKVRIIISIVKRKNIDRVIEIIKKHNPNAFVTIEDVRSVQGGIFPVHENRIKNTIKEFRPFRKGK